MADNLKQLIGRVNEVLDNTKGPNWVKVLDHNDIEQQIINKTGKNTGFPFLASANGIGGNIPTGTFSWNGNLMNNTNLFTVSLSDKTLDFNKIEEYVKLLAENSLIHFKDFVGRSVILKFKSYTKRADAGGNNVLDLLVYGVVDNVNYSYQSAELETCMLEFFNNLDTVLYPNIILKKGTVVIAGLNISLALDAFNWRINRVSYTNTPAYTTTLDPATAGFYRKDALLGDNTGHYLIVKGTEGDESVSPPTVFPINTIVLEIIDVFGATVTGTVPPVTLTEKTTNVDADKIQILNSQDSNKEYYWSWSKVKGWLLDFFRTQIEVGTSQSMQETWKGKLVIFTANCTITVPATLSANYAFEAYTLTGVTVSWAITTPKTWENGTPSATPEKTTIAVFQRGSTNSVILLQ